MYNSLHKSHIPGRLFRIQQSPQSSHLTEPLSVAPESFILICQQPRSSSDNPRDSELTWSFNSYQNGATWLGIDGTML
jgi:hypothetical protein